jgi:transcriptional regulator with XRE-family HTH domain
MKSALIPERLVKARENLNLNKTQVAELMGLSPIGYLRYEQGLRVPSVQMLHMIALALNTSVDYLTGKTDDPSADQILLTKSENPNLFKLVIELSQKDQEQSKRMLAYYRKISNNI